MSEYIKKQLQNYDYICEKIPHDSSHLATTKKCGKADQEDTTKDLSKDKKIESNRFLEAYFTTHSSWQ